jgi:hypothetical protein
MLISETHAPNDVYAEVRTHFSINAWNRLAIAFRLVPPAKAQAETAA